MARSGGRVLTIAIDGKNAGVANREPCRHKVSRTRYSFGAKSL